MNKRKNIKKENELCQITGKLHSIDELVPVSSIRPQVLRLIQNEFPELDEEGFISLETLNRYRQLYLHELLVKETGELNDLEKEVLLTLNKRELLSKNIDEEADERLTLAQRIADKVARFGGSWTFIITFFGFIIMWMLINILILVSRPLDPYPFILLNLILSCLAAIQAPIIMMSQNRQESKDRLRSQHDYQVNLKSELEIRQLHEKVDHLIRHQMLRLFEVQELQMDYLEEIIKKQEK